MLSIQSWEPRATVTQLGGRQPELASPTLSLPPHPFLPRPPAQAMATPSGRLRGATPWSCWQRMCRPSFLRRTCTRGQWRWWGAGWAARWR